MWSFKKPVAYLGGNIAMRKKLSLLLDLPLQQCYFLVQLDFAGKKEHKNIHCQFSLNATRRAASPLPELLHFIFLVPQLLVHIHQLLVHRVLFGQQVQHLLICSIEFCTKLIKLLLVHRGANQTTFQMLKLWPSSSSTWHRRTNRKNYPDFPAPNCERERCRSVFCPLSWVFSVSSTWRRSSHFFQLRVEAFTREHQNENEDFTHLSNPFQA